MTEPSTRTPDPASAEAEPTPEFQSLRSHKPKERPSAMAEEIERLKAFYKTQGKELAASIAFYHFLVLVVFWGGMSFVPDLTSLFGITAGVLALAHVVRIAQMSQLTDVVLSRAQIIASCICILLVAVVGTYASSIACCSVKGVVDPRWLVFFALVLIVLLSILPDFLVPHLRGRASRKASGKERVA